MSTGGLFRVARNSGPLAARVDGAGWRWHDVDLTGVVDRAGLFAALRRDLALPNWFGANWDALADALGDLGAPTPPPGAVIHIAGADLLASMSPVIWGELRGILTDAATEWTDRGSILVVLVRGVGGRGCPALDERSLPA